MTSSQALFTKMYENMQGAGGAAGAGPDMSQFTGGAAGAGNASGKGSAQNLGSRLAANRQQVRAGGKERKSFWS